VENAEHKCITCGFAAKRARIPIFPHANPAYFEIPYDERQRDKVLFLSTGTGNSAADTYDIACFRGEKDLGSLASGLEGQRPGGIPEQHRETMRLGDSMQVLEETGCDSWYRYESGRTPREHLSDLMWERLEEGRREFEKELSARAETVQLQLAERDEHLQARRDQEQARNTKLITRITLIGILIALAQVLTLTKDSLLWKVIAALYHLLTD
jgi:hypothetical protein